MLCKTSMSKKQATPHKAELLENRMFKLSALMSDVRCVNGRRNFLVISQCLCDVKHVVTYTFIVSKHFRTNNNPFGTVFQLALFPDLTLAFGTNSLVIEFFILTDFFFLIPVAEILQLT